MLGSIFQIFAQLDQSLERSQGGLGVGLTLVRKLVELHGGTVEVHSEGLGRGSEFVVRLPVVFETFRPAMPEPTIQSPKKMALRILVVDDNFDSAESLTTLLQIFGNETYTAHDGVAAVEAAANVFEGGLKNAVDNYRGLVRHVAAGLWLTRWRRLNTYHPVRRCDRVDIQPDFWATRGIKFAPGDRAFS